MKRTPLRRVSKKRQKEMREYNRLRRQFLDDNPNCEVCRKRTDDVHHMAGRGINYLDVDTWLSVCRACHNKIHARPSWAREKGYLV